MMVVYSDKEINQLLKSKRKKGEEDLLINQPDGTKACVGWELNRGYHLTKPKKYREISDEELLASAHKNLGKKKGNYQK